MRGGKLFAGGKGTPKDPYLISNARQLANIGKYPDRHYALLNDIVVPKDHKPVGSDGDPFTGSIDMGYKNITREE